MKAIETRYKGYRFRSRLEARWAVFFDTLKTPWEYELEGFKLPSGRAYLPDFYLPAVDLRRGDSTGPSGVWIEVKPTMPKGREYELVEEFAGRMLADGTPSKDSRNVIVLLGAPSIMSPVQGGHLQMGPGWDESMVWMCCRRCGRIKLEFYESSYDQCFCGGKTWLDHPALVAAETAGRSARFEHGERGTPSSGSAPNPFTPEIDAALARVADVNDRLIKASESEVDALLQEKMALVAEVQALTRHIWNWGARG